MRNRSKATAFPLGLALLVGLSGCTSPEAGSSLAALPCAELDRGDWAGVPARVSIPEAAVPHCRLVLDTIIVRNYTAAEADTMDISKVRTVDGQGNLYIQGYTPGVLTILSPAGEKIASLGRLGPGPGEFAPGFLNVEVTEHDTIYVQDNRLVWQIFTPERSFLRSQPLGAVKAGMMVRCILADGSVISSAMTPAGGKTPSLRLVGPDGTTAAEFGVADHPVSGIKAAGDRYLNCGPNNSVWALPNPVEPGYTLERWGPDGRLLNTITRQADWFEAGPPTTASEALQTRPSSEVRQVTEAGDGLIFVLVVGPDRRWQPITREEMAARMAQQLDVRIEALDAVRGQLLAVMLVDNPGALPNAATQRDGSSYEVVVDDSGDTRLMAYHFHLVDP